MKTFTRDYRIPHYRSGIFNEYFGAMKPCVFDIETSGLSRNSSKVILTAMLVPTESGVRVTQFLAENFYEEDRVLRASLDFIASEGIDYLITYNGISFDIPFFNSRCEATHLDGRLSIYNLDLYYFLRKHSILPSKLDSMSQKSVERHYGISSSREDRISGRESVRLYAEYAKNASTIIEKLILTHNREDVVQLYTLLLRAGANDFSSILREKDLHEALSSFGFASDSLVLRTKLNNKRNLLTINGDQLSDAISIEIFPEENEGGFKAHFDKTLRSLSIDLPLESYGKDLYVNAKALGLDNELQGHYGFVNGYLIIRSDDKVDYSAVNALSSALASSIRHSY